jgi:undecaprenyl diphosphate synthase
VVEAAPASGAGTLTLYAFSSDNWRRPAAEVDSIMGLFELYLEQERGRCVKEGVRVNVIGRRDRLPQNVLRAVEATEHATHEATQRGAKLHVRIAVDYSSRDMLLQAARRCSSNGDWSREMFSAALGQADHGGGPAPDVDLLIRTGGEQRLSDFLLWECAYAELLFVERMWPDFDEGDLGSAVEWFRARERRFGGVPETQSQLHKDSSAIYSQTL